MEEFLSLLRQKNLQIITYHQGYIPKIGKYSGEELNPYCLVKDEREPVEKIFYVMYCKPNNITYISKNDIEKVLFSANGIRDIWSYSKYRNGIISSKTSTNKQKVIHCVIKNTVTRTYITHYNNNIFDNRQCNLRYHTYLFDRIIHLPSYFKEWYAYNKKTIKFPKYCLYVMENQIKYKYFKIDNEQPELKRKNITYEIASSKDNYNPKNLIEKYLQIERGLQFLNDKCGTDWTYDELIDYMMQ